MRLDHLWLTDWRSWAEADLALAPGLTAVVGPNGQGKTNLLEAIGYLATNASFRGAPTEALVRVGAARAVVRGEGHRGSRSLLLETEVVPGGRSRMMVNRQPVRRARDLFDALRVSVFSPDDLELVKGGPGGRRDWVDGVLAGLHPRNAEQRADLDRVLRQRNTLLKQAGGRLTEEVGLTLDVWDAKLAEAGEAVAASRADLLDRLAPALAQALRDLAGVDVAVAARYVAPWREGGLAAALAAGRVDDVRRGLSLVGPHRDEVEIRLDGLPARTHASQGEQRSLALALRLAAHREVAAVTGEPPVLLLDDVFSELDPDRSRALVRNLPVGQAVLTTAGALPEGVVVEHLVRVHDGVLEPTVVGG